MADEHWSDRVSQYLDGELSDTERAAADAHFQVCDTCRQQRDDFAAIRGWVRSVPPPPATTNPWPAITREISDSPTGARIFHWAAAILLPLAAGAGFWWASEGRREESTPAAMASAPVRNADADLHVELAALENRFRKLEARLDPRTAAAIRAGLSELDAALTRAEAELARDQDNALLGALVARARLQKVRLLRSVTES